MKNIAILVFMILQNFSFAQHCPWDCSGMLLLQTSLPTERFYKLDPVITDEAKNELYDTVYGTGKDTRDECKFLSYDDFTVYRIQRTAVHHFYEYDTFYHFAEGLYIVKFNFCQYQNRKLFLRVNDPRSGNNGYHYLEIPDSVRIHLHHYSNDLFGGNNDEIKKAVQRFILRPSCAELAVENQECK